MVFFVIFTLSLSVFYLVLLICWDLKGSRIHAGKPVPVLHFEASPVATGREGQAGA